MFFLLSKLFYFLLTPIVWFIGVCFYILFSKNQKRRKRVLIITIIVAYIMSNSFLVNECVRAWEIQTVHVDSLSKQYDYGIVLGGFNTYDSQFDRVNFNKASDRLWQALLLYNTGKIKKILISGGEGRIVQEGYLESVITRNFLVKIGVPKSDIIIEEKSRNTYENALYTKHILESQNDSISCLLITSAIHMRRAHACFSQVGLCCDTFSADRIAGPPKFIFDYCFIPSMNALENWRVLFREIAGYLAYAINRYV